MRPLRSTSFWGAWILSAVWLAAACDVAWGVPVADRAVAGRPLIEVSIRALKPAAIPGAVAGYRFLEGMPCLLERNLFADAADGRWDEHSLLVAALLASGVDDPVALTRYQTQVAGLCAELRDSGAMRGSPRERAQVLFEFMHRRVLYGGYEIDCTDLALALDQGRFNCVSASVLYNCLAGRFGLTARGLETPGHAKSRLILPDGVLDVETTCPTWFRLIGEPEKQAELVRKTIGVQPSAGLPAAEPREVSGAALVATIYYNRGVDLLGQQRFAEALAANAKALRLDPSSVTARGNLLATLNNWAIGLGNGGRYAEAIDLLRQGLALDPAYETFKANYVRLHYQWISDLLARGQRAQATQIAQQAMADPYLEGQAAEVIPRISSE